MNTHSVKEHRMTVAVCCYNAAEYLETLIRQLEALHCPIPFEILIVDNNSTDHTADVVANLAKDSSVPIRYVLERQQGIPFARNRAIDESLHNEFLAFIDSDELPGNKWLESAYTGLDFHKVDCVGGEIRLNLSERPGWLSDSLLPFLGKVDHGDIPIRVVDRSTPVWSGNVAYRTALFDDGLRFDTRYNRKGTGIGGGSDGIMFRTLLGRKCHIRYEPEMCITHFIPDNKLRRTYFLKLHFTAGKKAGMYEMSWDGAILFGAPRYMYQQLVMKAFLALKLLFTRDSEYMREAMNVSYLYGVMSGFRYKSRSGQKNSYEK